MYLYYDKTRTLKEIINDKAIVSGSVNANKIYVMYENDQEESGYTTSYICYLKGNGDYTDTYLQNAVTNPYATEPSEDCYVPYDEKRDLKFFKYGKPYRFRVFNIPNDELKGYSSASGTVWYVLDPKDDTTISDGEVINASDDTTEAMTMFSFAINSSTGYVKKDDYISLSQWSQLLLLIDTTEIRQAIETLQSYFTGGAAKNALKLDDHTASYFASQSDLINALAALTYVSTFGGKSGAITLGSGLSMNGNELNVSGGGADSDTWRNIKVNGTEKLGTGTNTGALDLVAGSNITLTVNNGAVTITATNTDTNTWRSIRVNGVEKLGSSTVTNPLDLIAGTGITLTESGGAITISSSGGGQTTFNLLVCKNVAETPNVATITVGGTTAQGTLSPSESTLGTIYLCNDASNPTTADIYTEYITVKTYSEGLGEYQYNWEKFGTTPTSVSAGVSSIGGATGAITLGNNLSMSGNTLNVSIPTELFPVTYGVTTYAEITSALSSGKLPICDYGYYLYIYNSKNTTSNYYAFTNISGNYEQHIRVNTSNEWTGSGVTMEVTSNKVTSLSSASTDTQYPSAKCVYDALALKTDTWRKIKVNGVDKLGNATNTNALDLVAGTNITISENNGVVTISYSGGEQTSFNLIVCQTANETPNVATISVGGTTISGTLAPSASTLGTLYLCNDATNPVTNDIYTEYVTAQKPSTASTTINVASTDSNVSIVEDDLNEVYTITITVSDKISSVTSCDIQTTSITNTDHTIVLVMGGQAYEDFQRYGATIVYVPFAYFWEKFGTTPTSVTAGVTSLGGVNGAITLGTGLTMSGSQLKPDGLTKTLIFASGIPQWASDNTYLDYPYKGTISNLTGVTSSDYAEVVYSVDQAVSGNYAPICETGSSCVYVYSKVNNAIIIPTIKVDKIL